jgi:hypothetical protein
VKEERAFFTQACLPFGACCSVYLFNRLSKCLWKLGIRLFGLFWANYFDDFPMLEPKATVVSAFHSAHHLLKVLGWSVATDAGKSFPFQACFAGLGVEFDLALSSQRILTVKNKESRVAALNEAVDRVLRLDCLSPNEAAVLRGRFLYAAGQLFGKTAASALFQLGPRARQTAGSFKVDELLRKALTWLTTHITTGRPRAVPMPNGTRPLLVFTDGAYEPTKEGFVATCGGALLADGKWYCFGSAVPDVLIHRWLSGGGTQPISQVELLPVLIARRLWSSFWPRRKALFFIDNDSSREGLVKGYSPNEHNRSLIMLIAECELANPCYPWYARVASKANIADGPSRLCFKAMMELGAERCALASDLWPV